MITKKDIEAIKDEIFAFAKKHNLGKDFSVFCNGNLYHYKITKNFKYRKETVKDVNPLDYCEYFPEEFLIGLAYDGTFYEFMNGYLGYKTYEKFEEMLRNHGMWIEHSDYCHAAIYYDGNDEVEYMNYKKEEIKFIVNSDDAPTKTFKAIMDMWREFSREYGDVGSCVIGEYLELKYKGITYRVAPQSPYQGSCSWESSLDIIKKCFEHIGATDIYYNPGHLD